MVPIHTFAWLEATRECLTDIMVGDLSQVRAGLQNWASTVQCGQCGHKGTASTCRASDLRNQRILRFVKEAGWYHSFYVAAEDILPSVQVTTALRHLTGMAARASEIPCWKVAVPNGTHGM